MGMKQKSTSPDSADPFKTAPSYNDIVFHRFKVSHVRKEKQSKEYQSVFHIFAGLSFFDL